VTLRFDKGESLEILCFENEDVVAAALRQEILLVSNCREGMCGACKAEVLEGEYEMRECISSHVLSEQEADNGVVLACQMQPRDNLVLAFDYGLDRVDRFAIGEKN
jgi:methane monooxygenase component C